MRVLDLLWDYRRGYYVSARYAPWRFRLRRWIEKHVLPKARRAALAVLAALAALEAPAERAVTVMADRFAEVPDFAARMYADAVIHLPGRHKPWERKAWAGFLAALVTVPWAVLVAVGFALSLAAFGLGKGAALAAKREARAGC
jgi:hypothetical protein